MSAATLTVRDVPGAPGVREVVLDCPHGATRALAGGAAPLPDGAVVSAVLAAHHASEGCGCTAALLARYGGVEAN